MSGKSLTFYSLFDDVHKIDFVEIPILQRDYAQGRQEEEEVRSLFLRSLFRALTQDDNSTIQPLDLDFVYGNYINAGNSESNYNKVLSVLDGQQRLTTLFLLHWYLAVVDDRIEEFKRQFVSANGQSRFTYKVRPSTTEFFNALVASDITLGDKPISTQISDCKWFYLSWKQDPTVQACLCMLDAIQKCFGGVEKGLFDRLADKNNPYITFQFLDLHSFGLSDELYIKMNARGKPLTVFENFKAKLEQHIDSYAAPWPEYHLPFRQGVISGYDYFIHKIDTDWADLFWPYRNARSKDNTFDDEFMNFFRLIIMIQALLNNRECSEKLNKLTSELFGISGQLKELSISKYDELGCFNQNLIVRFIQTIDLIYGDGLENNHIRTYLDDDFYYSEEVTFKCIIDNSANYDDKLRFFAFYNYLANNKNLSDLKNWMRVIYNLVENTITDSPDDFYKAIFVIDDLCQIEEPILEALKADCKLSIFLSAQILEEKIKAHLILKSDEWRQAVIDAERHPFFKGQIGSILNFCGVLEFYRKQMDCNWNDDLNQQYYDRFNYYFDALAAVFNQISGNSGKIGYAWERAVLSKGNYCTEASNNRLNLLHSWKTTNNIPRDHSWRRRLRIGNDMDEIKQSYVKAVLDDPLFNADHLQDSLEEICTQSLNSGGLEPWRRALIKHKEIFDISKQGFIVHNADETVVLKQSQRNHYHCELFTQVLEFELNAEKEHLQPFTEIICEYVRSRDDDEYVHMTGYVLDNENYEIVIIKDEANFSIYFQRDDCSECSDRLKIVLEQRGFLQREDSEDDIIDFLAKQPDIQQAKNVIFDLCSDLKELRI